MAAKDELGRRGEQQAADHVAAAGFTVLDRNWRCAQGELDIVARRGPVLAIVEVKTRTSNSYGDPLSAVGSRKRARLWRLACAWRDAHPDLAAGTTMRLDVVGILAEGSADARVQHMQDVPWV